MHGMGVKQPDQGIIPSTKENNGRSRRKSRWKLKFHHQALPPEYLNHYEASMMTPQPTTDVAQPPTSPVPSISTFKSKFPLEAQTSVRFDDLPYMGEMTLDNAKPRRGRKPKKADICHLIYKNYGTTVVEEPLNLCVRDQVSPVNDYNMNASGSSGSALPESINYLPFKDPKRKSKKSLARERLEKTFKEKGFLIQTQQLESAQGATYCKFRQLRKFTRYLFRSWKHHLPGDVVDTNPNSQIT